MHPPPVRFSLESAGGGGRGKREVYYVDRATDSIETSCCESMDQTPMTRGAKTVLVVGAGPIGLTAAIELARRRIPVRIIEKRSGFSAHSKGLVINPRSLELLEASGASRQLLAAGHKVARLNIRDGQRRLFTADFSKLEHRHPCMLMLPQSETERILNRVLAELGVKVERSCELHSLRLDDASATAGLVRADGSEVSLAAHFVVGADGAHSFVRQSLGIPFAGESYPHDWSLADVVMDWPLPADEVNLILSEGGLLLVAPIREGQYRLASDQGDAIALLPGRVKTEKVLWTSRFRISHRQVSTYQSGRAFLCGDAAHIHSPVGGRGMNLGIEDACVLAEMIARGETEAYSGARLPVGRRVLRTTDAQTRLLAARSRLIVALRNHVIYPLLQWEPIQRRLRMEMTGLASAGRERE